MCNVVAALSSCALPLIAKTFFDFLSEARPLDQYSLLFTLLVVNFVLLVLVNALQRKATAKLSANVIGDLRLRILKKIQLSKLNSKKAVREAQVITNFTSSLTTLEYAIDYYMWRFINLTLTILFSGVMLFYFEWTISLMVFFIVIGMLYIPNYFSKKAAFYLDFKRGGEQELVEMVHEEMALHKVIRIFLLTDYRQQLFEKILQKSKHFDTKYYINYGLIGVSSSLATYFLRATVLIAGVLLIEKGYLTWISLAAFYLVLTNFMSALGAISGVYASVAHSGASLEKIEELLAEPEIEEEPRQQIVLPPFLKSIEFKDAFFKYKEEYILSNINLEILAGQSVAFVGPSGSGKSTMLSLLLHDNKVTHGQLLFDGINLDDIYLPSLFKQIGVIYQDSLLFNTTIGGNICMGKQTATKDEIIAATQQAELSDYIADLPLGYDTPIGKKNQSLSGGQSQRIAIARALISNPAILYLDEATSALDSLSCDAIDETINKMAGKRTIISFTHRLKSIVKADQIIVMDKGEIVERGVHEELLAKQGLYSQLWEKQHGVTLSQNEAVGTFNPLWFKFVPLFSSLEPEVIEVIANEFEVETVEENMTIFNEGDYGNKFYVIAAGAVSVQRNIETQQNDPLPILVDGDFFGEIALLSNVPRNATIRTVSASIFMTLTKPRFNKVLMQLPEDIRQTLLSKAMERS